MATEIKSWNPMTDVQAPFRWREPGWVRIEDDVFAMDVKDGDIDRILGVVALMPHLMFIMPTAHTERMADLLRNRRTKFLAHSAAKELRKSHSSTPWPLPNLLPGAIVEDQATADERIPHLLRCPASVRMVDARLRGAVDMSAIPEVVDQVIFLENVLTGEGIEELCGCGCGGYWAGDTESDRGRYRNNRRVNFVTCRGTNEPLHPAWVRSLRDQCAAAGVPFAFFGWGDWSVEHESANPVAHSGDNTELRVIGIDGRPGNKDNGPYAVMRHVSSARSGRLLDGVEHDGMPEVGR